MIVYRGCGQHQHLATYHSTTNRWVQDQEILPGLTKQKPVPAANKVAEGYLNLMSTSSMHGFLLNGPCPNDALSVWNPIDYRAILPLETPFAKEGRQA